MWVTLMSEYDTFIHTSRYIWNFCSFPFDGVLVESTGWSNNSYQYEETANPPPNNMQYGDCICLFNATTDKNLW